MKHQKFRSYSLLTVFLAIIAFPLINAALGLVTDIKSFENRALAPRPVFDVEHLDPFPAQYEKYFDDRFSIRSRMVRWFSFYNIDLLKKSPMPGHVIIGSHGWLFSAGPEQDSYIGRNAFKPEQLREIKQELEYRQRYLAERNIKFYVLIAPAKPNIYSEYMRAEEYKLSPLGWGEQLVAYLNANCSVKPVNIYDLLREHKAPYDLYYQLDNHWNSVGALYASNAAIDRIHQDFPQVTHLPVSDYTIKRIPAKTEGNIQQMLGVKIYDGHDYEVNPKGGFKAQEASNAGYKPPAWFPYPWIYEQTMEIKDSKLPHILVISDSFGDKLFPLLAENFGRSVKIFDGWEYKLNDDIVNNEKPDIVLLLMHEPIIPNFLQHQSRPR